MTKLINLQELKNHWLNNLATAWSQILISLLDQEHGESLERLQLVSVDIEILTQNINSQKAHLSRISEAQNNFLVLTSYIDFLKITIKYFIRGARKYYKPQEINLSGELINLDPIKINNIQDFFTNNYFYDKDLQELNGYTNIIIPNHIIIIGLIQECLRNHNYKNFNFTFYRALFCEQNINLVKYLEADTLTLGLQTQDNLAVIVKAY